MKPLYISFFTDRYRETARELRATLNAFGLDHALVPVASAGSWHANTHMKPVFIEASLRQYPDRPIVWVDADARIRKHPELFDLWGSDLERGREVPDFAAHWLGGLELLSGTLWFGPTDAARRLAAEWVQYQRTHVDLVDQVALERLIPNPAKAPAWLRVRTLPAEYVAIFDHPDMSEPDRWVISHHQMSRQTRHESVL